jgi:hypothetical protein
MLTTMTLDDGGRVSVQDLANIRLRAEHARVAHVGSITKLTCLDEDTHAQTTADRAVLLRLLSAAQRDLTAVLG